MIILGIDPSIASTGWAALGYSNNNFSYIGSGVIKTKPMDDTYLRYKVIITKIREVISACNPQPAYCVMEVPFLNINPQSSLKLATARGIILSAVIDANIKLIELSPRKIKQSVSGSGSADKLNVKKAVELILPILKTKNISSDDETDAIACALSFRSEFQC